MPLTPFTGLSVTLHLLVIFINKLFRRAAAPFGVAEPVTRQARVGVTKCLSLLIMFCVIFVTFVSAFTMVFLSVNDEDSSLRYAEEFYNGLEDENEVFVGKFAVNEPIVIPYAPRQPIVIPYAAK